MKKRKDQQKRGNASKQKGEKINCFELKINKKKYDILGNVSKHDRGMPGISRNKINKQRLELLQKTTLLAKKSNSFVDNRVSEFDETSQRLFAGVRRKSYKKNIFNLNDDGEELTHLGKPLHDLENVDKPGSDSEDEDAQLGSEYVNDLHFGGFHTKSNAAKSRKEIMEDIIVESKRKKAEKKYEKEVTVDMTDKLDEDWKDMQSVVSAFRRRDDEQPKAEVNTYDMTVQQMRFSSMTGSKNLKTEEQLKKEEEEKLKKLEQERISRMNPTSENQKRQQVEYEMSADGIYDGLDIDNNFSVPKGIADSYQFQNEDENDEDNDQIDEERANTKHQSDYIYETDSPAESGTLMLLVSRGVSIPLSVEEFSKLVKDQSPSEISLTIESLIKSNSPNLQRGNKDVLMGLFAVLLEYLCKMPQTRDKLMLLNMLVPHLYGLVLVSSLKAGLCFLQLLKEKYSLKDESISCFPSLECLILLKLCGIFFSTSDFHHPIVTPALMYMSNILCKPYKITCHNVLSRLFISCLFFEYTEYSKRLALEPINFLLDILYLATKSKSSLFNYSSKYRISPKKQNFLLVNSAVSDDPVPINMEIFLSSDNLENTDDVKVSIIYCSVRQLLKCVNLYADVSIFSEIFGKVKTLCQYMPIDKYPPKLASSIEELSLFVNEKVISKYRLKFPKKRPPILKLFEPNFEMAGRNNERVTFAKKLRLEKELSQKAKREEKGLMRTMRRDAQFLSREQLRQRMEADSERSMKVKKLCHDLAVQEGEFKKFSKK